MKYYCSLMEDVVEKRRTIYLRAMYYFLFSVVAIVLFLNKFDVFKYFDVDLLWHIRVGEDIVCNRSISIINNYSWIEGTLWTQHEWLFDVVIYLVSKHLNVFGYMFIGLLIIGLTYAIPYIINNWKYRILSLLMYYSMYYVFSVNTINRPVWYSVFAILAIMIVFDTKRLSNTKKLMLFAFLGVLLSNFHAGMIVAALAVLVLNIVFEMFFVQKLGGDNCKKRKIFLISYAIAFLFGYMVNPLGPYRFVEMFKVAYHPSTSHIPEWSPVSVSSAMAAFVIALMFFSIGYGFSVAYKAKDVMECRRSVVVCAIICLGLMSQKSAVVVILFFMSYAYRNIEIVIDDVLLGKAGLRRKIESINLHDGYMIKGLPVVLVAFVSLIITIPFVSHFQSFDDYAKHGFHPSYYVDMYDSDKCLEDIVSQDILDYLKSESDQEGFSILNSYIMGNYLVWERIPTFVDSRQQPYSSGITDSDCSSFDELIALSSADEDEFQSFLDKYEFEYVIIGNSYVVYNAALTRNMNQTNNYELIMYDETSDCSLYHRIE